MAEDFLEWINSVLDKYEVHKDNKVCVVTLIGKSPVNELWSKGVLMNDLFDRHIFQNRTSVRENDSSSCEIEAYFDADNRCIFLNLISPHDLNIKSFDNVKDYHENWNEKEKDHLSHLLFLFSISQIVMVVHPTSRFDLSYLRLLRNLNDIRESTLTSVHDLIVDISGVTNSWASEGRPSCPRLLFLFYRPPSFMRADGTVETKKGSYKKLAACLEDQIYKLFRKSRVITNNTSNSVCSLPQKQSFCYIFGPNEEPKSFGYDILANLLKSASNLEDKKHDFEDRGGFKHFFFDHLDLAHADGLDDNVGKVGPAHFELPKLKAVVRCAPVLYEFFVTNRDQNESLAKLNNIIDVVSHFSENRCKKVYPIALSHYQDGLPAYYSQLQHNAKLLQTVLVLKQQARGPYLKNTIEKLAADCEAFWLNGRKSCEVYSLTGNMCINQLHRAPGDKLDVMNSLLHVTQHTSSARFFCTCECGRRQAWRDDPFDIFQANYAFFASCEFACCRRLQRLEPPVFKRTRRTHVEGDSTTQLQAGRKISVDKLFENFRIGDTATQEADHTGTNPAAEDFLLDRDNRPASLKVPMASQLAQCRGEDRDSTEINFAAQNETSKFVTKTQELSDARQSLSQRLSTSAGDQVAMQTGREGTGSQLSDVIRADRSNPAGSDEKESEEEKYDEAENADFDSADEAKLDEYDSDDEGKWKTTPVITPADNENRAMLGHEDEFLIDAEEYYESLQDDQDSIAYLSSMVHSHCQPGLLPLFPSWSLICIGHSSLYSHSTGLRDNPNFSHGSQYLLPFDVTLSSVDLEKWHDLMEVMASTSKRAVPYKKPRLPLDSKNGAVYVKLFVGFEYECPRGHRFMMQAPDKILKHSGIGGPRDSGNLVATNDMPIWFPCSCRLSCSATSSTVSYGQLMRLHVITPKAPVLVSLNVRVQPQINGLVFEPGFCTPPKLGPAQYWVMRLPFSYVTPHSPVYPPNERSRWFGRVFKNAFSIAPDF